MVLRNLDTSALAATIPFVRPSLAMQGALLAGVAGVGRTPVLLDPFDRCLDNANQVVIAPAVPATSSCKLLSPRQLINGTECIAIDREDEHRPLADAVDRQIVRLAASSAYQLNPFDLPPPFAPTAGGATFDDEDPLSFGWTSVSSRTPAANFATASSARSPPDLGSTSAGSIRSGPSPTPGGWTYWRAGRSIEGQPMRRPR